jgi:hypothetical protein
VRAEECVRVRVLAAEKPVELLLRGGRHSASTSLASRRSIPATGIATQSGRLLSS